jgi:hypothetical protein
MHYFATIIVTNDSKVFNYGIYSTSIRKYCLNLIQKSNFEKQIISIAVKALKL